MITNKIIFSLNNSVNQSPFTYITQLDINYNHFFNKDQNSVNINYMENINDPKLVLFIISLIKNAKFYIYQIIINVFCNIYSIINNEQNQQNNLNEEAEEENNDNQNINIIKLDSTFIQKAYNKLLKLSIQQLKLKKNIYSRNKDDILNKNHEKLITSDSSSKKLNYSPSSNLSYL